MKAVTIKQLLSDLINGRCADPGQTIKKIGSSPIYDSQVLQVYLSARNSYYACGMVRYDKVFKWLSDNARSATEREDLVALLQEIAGMAQCNEAHTNTTGPRRIDAIMNELVGEPNYFLNRLPKKSQKDGQ